MTNKKAIIFDLDETMGYFQNFGIFFYTLQNYLGQTFTSDVFNKLIDLYPEILRPLIFDILKFILDNKKYHDLKIMIYTNNQGPKEWIQLIKNYFENKLKTKIFDKIIYAFMINGKKIEPARTTHQKTYKDLLKTTKIPRNTKICFIDDVYFEEMEDDNVYYINIEPYTCSLNYVTMVKRLIESKIFQNVDEKYLIKNMANAFKNIKFPAKKKEDYEIDVIISKKIIMGLEDFLLDF